MICEVLKVTCMLSATCSTRSLPFTTTLLYHHYRPSNTWPRAFSVKSLSLVWAPACCKPGVLTLTLQKWISYASSQFKTGLKQVKTNTPTACTHTRPFATHINIRTCSLPPSLILNFLSHSTQVVKGTESNSLRQPVKASGPQRGASFTAKIRRLLQMTAKRSVSYKRRQNLRPFRWNGSPRQASRWSSRRAHAVNHLWSLFLPTVSLNSWQ